MLDIIARSSVRWLEDDKFIFLWDEYAVLVHYNKEQDRYTLLTSLSPHVEQTVHAWLKKDIQRVIDKYNPEDGDL